MTKKLLPFLLSVFFLPNLAYAADTHSLLQRVGKYGQELSRIEASAKTASLENLLQQGDSLAAELTPVIEQLSNEDYAYVEKNMKGYIVNREEVILAEPDARFFSTLAEKNGTAQDRLYFQFMLKVTPDGYWPVYLMRQTDVGGCTDFGSAALSKLYREGIDLSPKLAGYYRQKLQRTIEDVADQLTTGTCACGTIAAVTKELKTFIEMNPNAPITNRVKMRLQTIERADHTIRVNCIGGT